MKLYIFIHYLIIAYVLMLGVVEEASADQGFSMSPSKVQAEVEPKPDLKQKLGSDMKSKPIQKRKKSFWDFFKRKSKNERSELKVEQLESVVDQKIDSKGPEELEVIEEVMEKTDEKPDLPFHYRFKTQAIIDNPKEKGSPGISRSQEYRLKPGDEIEISVWGEDMTKDLMVRPDGKISYILIDEILVVDKTFKQLKSEIEGKLSKYIIDPKVSIIGKSFEGNFVSILGAVTSPGRKVVSNSDHILDVLSKAGGLKFVEFGNTGKMGEFANLKNAYLSRGGQLVEVDFSKLLYEGDMSQNVPVQIGDFIYIPSAIDMPIYITGEFRMPTSLPFAGKPTLLEALSEANGFNIDANKRQLKVIRGGLVEPEIINYNYYDIISGKINNPILEPGDIVYAPPTNLTKIERISTQVIPFLDSIIRTGESKDTIKNW